MFDISYYTIQLNSQAVIHETAFMQIVKTGQLHKLNGIMNMVEHAICKMTNHKKALTMIELCSKMKIIRKVKSGLRKQLNLWGEKRAWQREVDRPT